jgi:hypothetical protein
MEKMYEASTPQTIADRFGSGCYWWRCHVGIECFSKQYGVFL